MSEAKNDFIELSRGGIKPNSKHTDRVQAPEGILDAFGEETGYVRFVFFEEGPIFDGNFNGKQLIGSLAMALSQNEELLDTFTKGVELARLIAQARNSFIGDTAKEFAVEEFNQGNQAAKEARAKRASKEPEPEQEPEPKLKLKNSGVNFTLGEA